MEVLSQATELFERIDVQIKATENIEKQSGEQTKAKIQLLKFDLMKDKEIVNEIIETIQRGGQNREEINQLLEKIRNFERKAADSQMQIIRLEWEVHEKDKWIKELNTDIQQFKHQMTVMNNSLLENRSDLTEMRNDYTRTKKDLLQMKGALQTGQLVYNFEKDLASYIYPPDKKIGSRKIFTTMKEWLEEMKGTYRGDEANKKWNDLKREFSCSGTHERVFFKLVQSRLGVAHPNVDLGLVQSYIDRSFTDEEKKCIDDMIEMTDRVNDLMKTEPR